MGKITNNELASLTRPSNPTNGLEIYETDTTNNYTWNGSIWENKLDVHKADYTQYKINLKRKQIMGVRY